MVNLSRMLTDDRVVMLEETGKDAVLARLVQVLGRSEKVRDEAALLEAIRGRELIMSTGVGFGIAVPHAKVDGVDDTVVAVGVSKAGIDFGSLDDEPVHIVVMIAAGSEQQEKYIRTLARVMVILKDPRTRRQIVSAAGPAEVHDIFINC